jgi:hypothetical protein
VDTNEAQQELTDNKHVPHRSSLNFYRCVKPILKYRYPPPKGQHYPNLRHAIAVGLFPKRDVDGNGRGAQRLAGLNINFFCTDRRMCYGVGLVFPVIILF